MQPQMKVYLLDENGERFFGEGPYQLLHLMEQLGSLRSAATEMGMAYTKAIRILTKAEQALGYPLTIRSTGGRHGGGSTLTEEGKALLEQYEAYRLRCRQENMRIFQEIFK